MITTLALAIALTGQCGPRGCPAPRYFQPATKYSMVDNYGQTWTHADVNVLRSFVNQRNTAPATYGRTVVVQFVDKSKKTCICDRKFCSCEPSDCKCAPGQHDAAKEDKLFSFH